MDYRLYVLDSAGKIAREEEWSCASEDEALERVARHVHSFGAELWLGERKVRTVAGMLSPRAER
jgi:hypothetical protein